ncbi:hypothetical protein AGDE_13319 [Angomonas deanei]|uniref:Uncharacterized protein n=1 Tax=Angomonas deanei TaxID=59799 RepID=A0A7G2C900_9TRYP|nr:hypothetical protein AGDE_13319 [Angomonas deanei]CAD2214482.1 hypothetical protein, conserved [Angomonas deanei]|eukprot:EPY22499.1 hypothetical protein AGDE_13319 [Angomonas deanei]
MDGAADRSEHSQRENRVLQGRIIGILNEKTALVEETSILREENRELREKYDQLKKEHDALVEEHRDYMEEMINLNTRLKQELEEAKDMRFKMEELEKVLMEKFYNNSTGQFDLIPLFNYCKACCIPLHVFKEALSADHRETLTLPNDLHFSVGDDNVEEFMDAILVSLPNLKSISGYYMTPEHWYIKYKRGKYPLSVLMAYCVVWTNASFCLTEDAIKALQSAELSVTEYLTTMMSLLPTVIILQIPGHLNFLMADDAMKEALVRALAPLPNLKGISEYFRDPLESFILYKQGEIPRETLKAYCAHNYRVRLTLNQHNVDLIQSRGLSVSDYLTTVMPLLPKVEEVSFITDMTTLDWCESLPDKISKVSISGCPNIKDLTPLLKMKRLKEVFYCHWSLRPFHKVKLQLRLKGVTCAP